MLWLQITPSGVGPIEHVSRVAQIQAIQGGATDAGDRRPLRLTSTGNLLPGHPAWAILGRARSLDFGRYGDWASVLFDPGEARFVVWALFLADVIPLEDLEDTAEADDGAIDRLLHPVIAALDARLSHQPGSGLVVAWSAPVAATAIEVARRRSAWNRVASRLESLLYDRIERFSALYVLPLDPFFARPGTDLCFDPRNHYAARCRLSAVGLRTVATRIAELLERIDRPARKLLILDCDNTLWGGTVGEDGLDGLRLGEDGIGEAYRDFQAATRALTGRGVVLALASKNEEGDVWRVFDSHPGMVLRRTDIAAHRIDWNEKPANIRAIADELGLGLDSVVFWDDNPLERERVRRDLPQVCTPEVPREVEAWPAMLNALVAFARFETTREDRHKAEQYEARRHFRMESRAHADETEFLRSIELDPRVVAVDAGTIARAAQLCAKTNQFNLRTVRHRRSDLEALASARRNLAFLVHLSDRFGDHGNVVLVICRTTSHPQVAFLDTFLVSCRVLGRHLEAWALQACVSALRASGFRWLVGEFRPTGRNRVAEPFLREHGFSRAEGGDHDALLVSAGLKGTTDREPSGEHYLADLNAIVIPHLDVFDRVAIDDSRAVAAAVS